MSDAASAPDDACGSGSMGMRGMQAICGRGPYPLRVPTDRSVTRGGSGSCGG